MKCKRCLQESGDTMRSPIYTGEVCKSRTQCDINLEKRKSTHKSEEKTTCTRCQTNDESIPHASWCDKFGGSGE